MEYANLVPARAHGYSGGSSIGFNVRVLAIDSFSVHCWQVTSLVNASPMVILTKTQDVKRRWAAQVDLQCRQQSLIGKRRRSLLIPVRLLA